MNTGNLSGALIFITLIICMLIVHDSEFKEEPVRVYSGVEVCPPTYVKEIRGGSVEYVPYFKCGEE